MKSYLNKMFSLKELALARVAINLCQESGFKEVAMQLERPNYTLIDSSPPLSMIELDDKMKAGSCFYHNHPKFPHHNAEQTVVYRWNAFINNSPPLSMIELEELEDKMEAGNRFHHNHPKFHHQNAKQPEYHWNTLINNECQRLTEEISLPDRLKKQIYPWMNRIALEYLCYSRKQETLFQVSRYFVMSLLTSKDLKEDCRLDEEKLALKLLEDERLTVLQKYLIACVHCLQVYISRLWEKLTQNEKVFVLGGGDRDISEMWRSLVSSWSLFMDGTLKECLLWSLLVSKAILCGNRPAVMVCWKRFKTSIQQQVVTNWALEALKKWYEAEKPFIVSRPGRRMHNVENFILPSYYGELMIFFLSQMDQEQQLAFLTIAAQGGTLGNATECFLDWPYQDDFIPSITQLWGIISKNEYSLCLMTLAKKYSENYLKENQDYDYRSLLRTLWKETPEEYKNFVLSARQFNNSGPIEGRTLLSQLSVRTPFQEEDQTLFKLVFRDIPQEKKRAMFLDLDDNIGFLCSCLIFEEKWSFLTWLLQECMPHEEITSFKRKFISSYFLVTFCLDILANNREKLVDDLLYWCSESTADQSDVSVINLCLFSVEKKKQLRLRFAECACAALLDNYARGSEYPVSDTGIRRVPPNLWKQMDKIIVWSIDAKEEQSKFKTYLFSRKGIETHFELIFVQKNWGKLNCFYKWFNLSPEEIKQLKWDTLFMPKALESITSQLNGDMDEFFVYILETFLTDEAMVMHFKNEVEEKYLTAIGQKKYLDELVHKLLHIIERSRLLQNNSAEQ